MFWRTLFFFVIYLGLGSLSHAKHSPTNSSNNIYALEVLTRLNEKRIPFLPFKCPQIPPEMNALIQKFEEVKTAVNDKTRECQGFVQVADSTINSINQSKGLFQIMQTNYSEGNTDPLTIDQLEGYLSLGQNIASSADNILNLFSSRKSCINKDQQSDFLSNIANIARTVTNFSNIIPTPYGFPLSVGAQAVGSIIQGISNFYRKNKFNFPQDLELYQDNLCLYVDHLKTSSEQLVLSDFSSHFLGYTYTHLLGKYFHMTQDKEVIQNRYLMPFDKLERDFNQSVAPFTKSQQKLSEMYDPNYNCVVPCSGFAKKKYQSISIKKTIDGLKSKIYKIKDSDKLNYQSKCSKLSAIVHPLYSIDLDSLGREPSEKPTSLEYLNRTLFDFKFNSIFDDSERYKDSKSELSKYELALDTAKNELLGTKYSTLKSQYVPGPDSCLSVTPKAQFNGSNLEQIQKSAIDSLAESIVLYLTSAEYLVDNAIRLYVISIDRHYRVETVRNPLNPYLYLYDAENGTYLDRTIDRLEEVKNKIGKIIKDQSPGADLGRSLINGRDLDLDHILVQRGGVHLLEFLLKSANNSVDDYLKELQKLEYWLQNSNLDINITTNKETPTNLLNYFADHGRPNGEKSKRLRSKIASSPQIRDLTRAFASQLVDVLRAYREIEFQLKTYWEYCEFFSKEVLAQGRLAEICSIRTLNHISEAMKSPSGDLKRLSKLNRLRGREHKEFIDSGHRFLKWFRTTDLIQRNEDRLENAIRLITDWWDWPEEKKYNDSN